MKNKIKSIHYILFGVLIIIAFLGIASMNFNNSFNFTNLYGQRIKMYGSGIYKNDSYLKAAIFIGSDMCTLFFLVPVAFLRLNKFFKVASVINTLNIIGLFSVLLYSSLSTIFSVTYNKLFLLYVLNLSLTIFLFFYHIRNYKFNKTLKLNKSRIAFFIFSGISIIIAWFPDIITSTLNNTHLETMESYTIEVTYILDMAIIGPLCILAIYLLHKKDPLGTIISYAILDICFFVGVLMVPQSFVLFLSNIEIPLPVLITKTIIFMVLAVFAYNIKNSMKKELMSL